MINTYSKKKDGDNFIMKSDGSPTNFRVREFACKDGSDSILIDVDFVVHFLQKIREFFKSPITILSGYRTPGYNKKVGGATNSYHCKGQAFDIVVKGKTPKEVASLSEDFGINGIIQYDTFVHIDSRTVKYWAKNIKGKISIVKSFYK